MFDNSRNIESASALVRVQAKTSVIYDYREREIDVASTLVVPGGPTDLNHKQILHCRDSQMSGRDEPCVLPLQGAVILGRRLWKWPRI
jgi:hypothetical protein